MEHLGSDKPRKWGVDSQECSVFTQENWFTFQIFVISGTFGFQFMHK